MKHTLLPACLLLSIACAPALAQQATRACAPTVEAGWVRVPLMAMPMLAGFATLSNRCPQPVAVVGASSPAFGSVELHESTVVDGVSRMRPVPRLPIVAGGSAELRPGGLHLMLMQPASAPKPGDRIEVQFILDDGRRVRGTLVAATAPPG